MKSDIADLSKNFIPGDIGSDIRYFDTLDSTNSLALSLPAAEIKHGMVLVAGTQSSGRGRQGREWFSTAGKGLFMTIVLLPEKPDKLVPLLGLSAALAIYDTLKYFCRSRLDIKWPNDVLLDGKKVSGILGETKSSGKNSDRTALGISINIHHQAEDFPAAIRNKATSILLVEGSAPSICDLLKILLEKLNLWYQQLLQDGAALIIKTLASRSSYIHGKKLTVLRENGEQLKGISSGLNEDGSLQLRLDSGVEIKLMAGDVHLSEEQKIVK